MFHIQLRQFPNNMCHFNMTERELLETVVEGWARGQWIEMGERKWNPHQAKLTVLEGPEIPVEQLSVGRGWPKAQHEGEDVTERMVEQAKQASQPAMAPQTTQPPPAPPAAGGLADQRLPLLGADPASLLSAWRLAAERRPELAPSESLELAEA